LYLSFVHIFIHIKYFIHTFFYYKMLICSISFIIIACNTSNNINLDECTSGINKVAAFFLF
jgi:hypothetical protein